MAKGAVIIYRGRTSSNWRRVNDFYAGSFGTAHRDKTSLGCAPRNTIGFMYSKLITLLLIILGVKKHLRGDYSHIFVNIG